MNYWQQPVRPVDTRTAGWLYVKDELKADVALLQETVPPSLADTPATVYREIAGYRPWGSAVALFRQGATIEELWAVRTRHSRRRFTLANTFPGSVAVAEVALEGIAPITFVSVYNVIDVYAQTTLLRIIADLIPLFDSAHGSRVVLGGDLNMSLSTTDPYYVERGTGILGALKSLGLVEATEVTDNRPPSRADCPCGSGGTCRHLATWKGADLDHVYVSRSLADEVRAIEVDTEAVARGLSDHAPLILDLALTHEPAPREWDYVTFAAEIGRRHGDDAREAVEDLYAWAQDKERRLRESGIRDVELTRFPTSHGAAPELWFQIDYRGTVPALMYSISIRTAGEGEVVVQFQWMRQPPFDTPEGHDELRRGFNAIPGVELPAERVNGRPSFPLRVIADRSRRELLIAILERIVDETRPMGGPVAEAEGQPT
jgi:endonuclease/exonuclease/phosphatase family metal-dependent hydrolase